MLFVWIQQKQLHLYQISDLFRTRMEKVRLANPWNEFCPVSHRLPFCRAITEPKANERCRGRMVSCFGGRCDLGGRPDGRFAQGRESWPIWGQSQSLLHQSVTGGDRRPHISCHPSIVGSNSVVRTKLRVQLLSTEPNKRSFVLVSSYSLEIFLKINPLICDTRRPLACSVLKFKISAQKYLAFLRVLILQWSCVAG